MVVVATTLSTFSSEFGLETGLVVEAGFAQAGRKSIKTKAMLVNSFVVFFMIILHIFL